jgi:hypothetical protein
MKFIFEKEKFISSDVCKKLIKYQKENCPKGERQGFWSNRTVYYYRDNIKKITDTIHKKIIKLIKDFYKEKEMYLDHSNLVFWKPGLEMEPHADNCFIHQPDKEHYCPQRNYSCVIYLNSNFKGGETYFPNQNYTIKPRTGKLIFFPSGSTHAHGVTKITKGNRYIMSMWFTKQPKYNIQ